MMKKIDIKKEAPLNRDASVYSEASGRRMPKLKF
jgi:hypothetical protein|tara:strand:- start:837 stop:938 length:102 start_codon:yes stop_codon:yes gene_type:complete